MNFGDRGANASNTTQQQNGQWMGLTDRGIKHFNTRRSSGSQWSPEKLNNKVNIVDLM